MAEKFYITTAIAYASKKPHVGNTYDIVVTDAIARFRRMQGYDVYFLTGSDEHGQKIETYAKEAGMEPRQYVNQVVAEIKGIWDLLGASYDQFIRTTEPKHVRSVQHIFKKLYDQGDIYKGQYEGMYCVACESFFTESQLVEGRCPDCGKEVKYAKEEAYFFEMSKYQDRLLQYYEAHPGFIRPHSREAEMVNNFLKPGLQDLCVSRTSFSWGIPVDFAKGHVVYVWVDALTNYITALGYDPFLEEQPPLFERYWPANLHVIGKDILRFHTIYWPIFLMALDLPLPKAVFGHSWFLSGNDKMSKSVGNVIYADDLVRHFTVDGLRYYLLANMPYDADGNITYENVLAVYNTDLANTIGNLVSRVNAMIVKYFDGVIPAPLAATPLEEHLQKTVFTCQENYVASMEEYHLMESASAVQEMARRLNKYIDETAPWVLAKEESQKAYLGSVLYHLCEGIRHLALILLPFIPDSASAILDALLIPKEERTFSFIATYDGVQVGGKVENVPPLFPRLDEEKTLAAIQAEMEEKAAGQAAEAESLSEAPITIEDFWKVELRAAKVMDCEQIQKSEKLLRLTLDDGSKEGRQVVSGIAPWYAPEDLVGKTVALVANLKPAKLRGTLSEGMILAADGKDGRVEVVFLSDAIPPGAKIR